MLGFNFILRAWVILALLVEGSGIEYGFRVYLIQGAFPKFLPPRGGFPPLSCERPLTRLRQYSLISTSYRENRKSFPFYVAGDK
jgi:hypothetical protein